MTVAVAPDRAVVERPGLVTPYKVLAALTAALLLVQALLAGRGWFLDTDLIRIHGYVGNAVFLAVVLQAGLAVALGARGSLRTQLLVVAGAIVVLSVAQIGLGYGGRESGEAAAWHIPNGVLIFGLTAYHLALLPRLGPRLPSSGR